MRPIIDEQLNNTLERTVKDELDDRKRLIKNINTFKKECRRMEKEYVCEISLSIETVDNFGYTFLTKDTPIITRIENKEIDTLRNTFSRDFLYEEAPLYQFEFDFIRELPEKVAINKKMVNALDRFIELYNRSLMRKLSTGYLPIDSVEFVSECCFQFRNMETDTIDFSGVKVPRLLIDDIDTLNDSKTKYNNIKLPTQKELLSVRTKNTVNITNMNKVLKKNPNIDISLTSGRVFH